MTSMNLNLNLGQRMEQSLRLAPKMIQSMEILQLPVMALEERIQQELVENPALELREPNADEFDEPVEFDDAAEPDGPLVIKDDAADDFNRLDAMERDLGEPLADDHRFSRAYLDEAGDRKLSAMANAPDRPQSLQDYLEEQVGFIDAPDEERDLVRYLISHIDDRGYLNVKVPTGIDPLGELQRNYPKPVTDEEIEDALLTLQRFEPLGVGARDLKECLLLQLTPDTPNRDAVRTLILNDHLEDIEHNRLPLIQKKTGLDIPLIQKAIEVIHHLNPKPGASFSSVNIPYVTPDVIVDRNADGEYEIKLVDDWIPDVHIPPSVIELAKNKSNDPEARKYIRGKIQAATWLLEAVQQRRATLEKVTRSIIKHQRAFLDFGPEHIEPLKMQEVADEVGVHVTTVSRAVDDKWVQTPRGIFPLKRFFGGGTQKASGEMVAWETIKNKLLEMIGQEDKANPLSDDEIVKQFEDLGYPVARRTVTKYRKNLHIPSSRQRKDWSMVDKSPDA